MRLVNEISFSGHCYHNLFTVISMSGQCNPYLVNVITTLYLDNVFTNWTILTVSGQCNMYLVSVNSL